MRVPLERSAFSTESRTDIVASRMLSTIPRLKPRAGDTPTPRILRAASSLISPTTVHTLVVPTSMEAKVPLFTTLGSSFLGRRLAWPSESSLPAFPLLERHAVPEPEVHGVHIASPPLRLLQEHVEDDDVVAEVAVVAEGGPQGALQAPRHPAAA